MNGPLRAVKITDRVFWAGAIDWAVRDFHGYLTSRGTSYNAYLIVADKVTLIDTVKEPFEREMVTRIAAVIDPRRIDYLVSNHAEIDHSGCIPAVIAGLQPERVFASTRGVAALQEMQVEVVGEGVRAQYVPDDAALRERAALGAAVADKLKGLPPALK